jgi:hypothetical protein
MNISIFIHKKSEGIRPYRDMYVQVPFRTGRKHLCISPVSSANDIDIILLMEKIVGSNSTHPRITLIGVYSGLKKNKFDLPETPQKRADPRPGPDWTGNYPGHEYIHTNLHIYYH